MNQPPNNQSQKYVQPPVPTNPITPPAQNQGAYSYAPKKPVNKGLVAALIAIPAALVLLIGGAVAAYNLWYQNPDRVIATALSGAMTATSGTANANITSEDSDYKVEAQIDTSFNQDGAKADISFNMKSGSATAEVKGSAVIINKDSSSEVYAMVDGLNESYESMYGSSLYSYAPDMSSLFKIIDGQWVVATDEDFASDGVFGSEAKYIDEQCVADFQTKFKTDKSYSREITNAYKNNIFIDVAKELGSKDGNLGYQIQINKDKLNDFLETVKSSKIVTAYRDCATDEGKESIDQTIDGLIDSAGEYADDINDTTVVVWIDRWSHELKTTTISYEDEYNAKTEIVIDTDYTANVTIEAPDNAMPAKEFTEKVTAEYEKFTKQLFGSTYDYGNNSSGSMLDLDSFVNIT